MEFYSSDVLNVSSSSNPSHSLSRTCPPSSSTSASSSSSSTSASQSTQLGLVNYHHHQLSQNQNHHHHATPHSFGETDSTMASAEGDHPPSNPPTLFQPGATPLLAQAHPPYTLSTASSDALPSQETTGTHPSSDQQGLLVEPPTPHYRLTAAAAPQEQQPRHLNQLNHHPLFSSQPSPGLHHHELEFQYQEIHAGPLSSDAIPRSTHLDLDLSTSLLLPANQGPTTSAADADVTWSCYVDCSDLGTLPFQSSVDQALMGFDSSFNFQEHHRPSDHEVDNEEQSNCTPTTELSPFSSHHQQQATQKHQIHFHQTQRHAGWQSFRSPCSSFEDDQNQLPLSPTEMAAMRSSPPSCMAHSSDLYFNSSPLYRYTQAGAIPPYTESVSLPSYAEPAASMASSYSEPPLAIVLAQSPTVLRNNSTTSEFSQTSSVHSNGVNPIHVNPLSQPMTPPDDLFAPMNDPFHQSWWAQPSHHSPTVESFMGGATGSLDPCIQNPAEPDVGVRLSSIFAQPLKLPCSSPAAPPPSSPYAMPDQPKLAPPSPPFHLPHKPRRTSHRPHLATHQRIAASKLATRPFLVEPDYSRLPTKRSRGRRPPISPDLGLPIPDGHLSIGLQAVPGGQAFDPNLNPNAETVKYCELTKTGKPKKIFICQVKGCGKCFKRSEHLKRHVRSIHTNDKPYNCPWMACMKSFSRHDNLNQHLRVHRVEEGGEVLNGLHVGSDGVLRADADENPVCPAARGLRNVEVLDRFVVEE